MRHFVSAATAIKLLVLFSLIPVFSACDTTREVELYGSYSLNATGNGVDERFRGNVFLGNEKDDQNRDVAVIYLTQSNKDRLKDVQIGDGDLAVLARAGTIDDIVRRPYNVDDLATFDGIGSDFIFILVSDRQEVFYVARGGTVNITRATGDVIEGTLDMNGVEITVATKAVRDITISGRFASADRIILEEPLFFGPAPFFFTFPLF